jgi:hypothetical protein
MIGLTVLVSALFSPVAGENLLANPSFEERTPDGRPRGWSSFVMPQPGAFADTDPLSLSGDTAVILHNPEPYEKEPANNWSQVVVADVRGWALEVSGYVRTEAAGEAALWIQCFQQRPARVVAAQTSASNTLMVGTRDWTRVSARVTAPPTTDFVVVRCVLKGRGSAWFDEISLEALAPETPEFDVLEPPADVLPQPPTGPASELDAKDILDLSRALQQAVADLENTNLKIQTRVQQLEADLEASRVALNELNARETQYGRHPLVPHGYSPEGEPE